MATWDDLAFKINLLGWNVKRIENEAKTSSGKLARVKVLYERSNVRTPGLPGVRIFLLVTRGPLWYCSSPRWRLDQSEHDTWHWRVSVRGTVAVSPRTSSNPRNQVTVQEGRVVVQNVQGRQNRGQGNNARGAGAAGYGGAQNKVRNANPGQARQNGVAMDEERLLFLAGGQDNVVDEDVDEQPIQDLALNVDNVFQANNCDAFDSDVDEAPTAQTMFMANLSSPDPVYDEASPSYDSDVLSEVDNTSDSNMIPYDQYVKDNTVPVVQNNVSSVPNDAYMMILNDIYELSAQCVSVTSQKRNIVVNNSLTAELETYKEQVELYERRARFELTKREQKIDEQLRIVITDRNIKEENLKKELHSVKLQLAFTINHNKSMVEEVTSLKKDFKQKENKSLMNFWNMEKL
ncbi:hypothetical protein Tco_1154379 [Tanacetum coccineum]